MSQSPFSRQSPSNSSPLTARLYDLEYPRSLGVYSTYQEVQSVVDTLADNEFPVQSTLIVGTDLKLMERVTGRRTWPKVIGQGVLSGLWMGLFLVLLFMLITPGDLMIVISSVLMGIVFFTVWSVIGYAMTGGKRDFTSMTSTIPMQYELLVEHKHADQARRILAETGAGPAIAPAPAAPGDRPAPHAAGRYGSPTPSHGNGRYGAPASGTPSSAAPVAGAPSHGAPSTGAPASAAQGRYGAPAVPAAGAPEGQAEQSPRPQRPSFGRPADSPQHARPANGDEQPGGPASEQHDDGSPQR
jgi:hypothetical protein